MKITLTSSRIPPPTAPPDVGSSSTNASSSNDAAQGSTTARPTIRIKQLQGSPPSSASSSAADPAAGTKRKRPSNTGASVSLVGRRESRRGDAHAEKVYDDGLKLYNALRNYQSDGRTLSQEFMHLPPRSTFPDYYELIKKPISFAEIKAKLERREYSSLAYMKDDFHQMFLNAKRYNQSGSAIYVDAQKLDKRCKTVFDRIMGISLDVTAESEDETPAPQTEREDSQTDGRGPPKKKKKPDDKPITLTKWLSNKVDDLVAYTDSTGRPIAEIFVHLPDQNLYPDYYQLIQRPVSFQLVRSRLKNRNYPSIQAFANDVNTIFTNAQFYNEEGSIIWQDSKVLQAHFAEIMKEDPPEFYTRPRNQAQQLTAAQATAERQALQGGRYKPPPEPLDSPGILPQPVSYDIAGAGIEHVQFADEFEAEDMQVDEMDRQANEDAVDSKSASRPLVASKGTAQTVTPPTVSTATFASKTLSPPQAKSLARLALNQTPVVPNFKVSFLPSESSQAEFPSRVLSNTIVRQHTVVCPQAVERVRIAPYMSKGHQNTALKKIRPSMGLEDAMVSSEERASGVAIIGYMLKLKDGLNVIELGTYDGKDVYRIFINRYAG